MNRHTARAGVRRARAALAVESLENRRLLTSTLSPHEQLLLELINRARANPAAESERLATDLNAGLAAGTISPEPKQPLAPHPILLEAAARHAQDMLDRDYFEHDTPEGLDPTARAALLGYSGSVGENLSTGGSTGPIDQIDHVVERHDELFRSSSHRINLMDGRYREAGPAVRFGLFTTGGRTFNSSMVAESFGFATTAYLTGVAFADTIVADRFYSVGEGLANIVVTATNSAGTAFTTTTGAGGGYALPLPNGSYSVIFSRAADATAAVPVAIAAGSNQKLDFDGVFPGDSPPPPPPPPPAPPPELAVQSVQPQESRAYRAGQRVRFTVTLSQAVQVSGRPQLQLRAGSATRTASYVSGSGSEILTFEYPVGARDNASIVTVGPTIVFGRNGSITAGTASLPTALPAGIAGAVVEGVRFDAVAPRVAGRVGVPGNGTFTAGQPLDFVVRFSEPVVVAGTPRIGLTGLASPRQATFVSGSGSQALTFRYVVQAGDAIRGTRGIALAKAITMPGGATIADAAGNRAAAKISAPSLRGIRIDATAAAVAANLATSGAAPKRFPRAVALASLR